MLKLSHKWQGGEVLVPCEELELGYILSIYDRRLTAYNHCLWLLLALSCCSGNRKAGESYMIRPWSSHASDIELNHRMGPLYYQHRLRFWNGWPRLSSGVKHILLDIKGCHDAVRLEEKRELGCRQSSLGSHGTKRVHGNSPTRVWEG